jgi:hypothetical protein
LGRRWRAWPFWLFSRRRLRRSPRTGLPPAADTTALEHRSTSGKDGRTTLRWKCQISLSTRRPGDRPDPDDSVRLPGTVAPATEPSFRAAGTNHRVVLAEGADLRPAPSSPLARSAPAPSPLNLQDHLRRLRAGDPPLCRAVQVPRRQGRFFGPAPVLRSQPLVGGVHGARRRRPGGRLGRGRIGYSLGAFNRTPEPCRQLAASSSDGRLRSNLGDARYSEGISSRRTSPRGLRRGSRTTTDGATNVNDFVRRSGKLAILKYREASFGDAAREPPTEAGLLRSNGWRQEAISSEDTRVALRYATWDPTDAAVLTSPRWGP